MKFRIKYDVPRKNESGFINMETLVFIADRKDGEEFERTYEGKLEKMKIEGRTLYIERGDLWEVLGEADPPPTPASKPDDYRSHHVVEYSQPNSRGWTSINVLSFLNGKKWDEVALAYVHALRPSGIRVTTGLCTMDSRVWRVTVILEDDNVTIREISQEVEVGLPEGIKHAYHLRTALSCGVGSKEERWFRDDPKNPTTMYGNMFGVEYKTLKDGTVDYFPGHEPDVSGNLQFSDDNLQFT